MATTQAQPGDCAPLQVFRLPFAPCGLPHLAIAQLRADVAVAPREEVDVVSSDDACFLILRGWVILLQARAPGPRPWAE